MKNQKNSLLSQGLSLNFGGDESINGANIFDAEPVQVENLDEKSALIVDFSDSSVQTKTLLDLEEAALVTKTVEPFFLDGKFLNQSLLNPYIYLLDQVVNELFVDIVYSGEWKLILLGGFKLEGEPGFIK